MHDLQRRVTCRQCAPVQHLRPHCSSERIAADPDIGMMRISSHGGIEMCLHIPPITETQVSTLHCGHSASVSSDGGTVCNTLAAGPRLACNTLDVGSSQGGCAADPPATKAQRAAGPDFASSEGSTVAAGACACTPCATQATIEHVEVCANCEAPYTVAPAGAGSDTVCLGTTASASARHALAAEDASAAQRPARLRTRRSLKLVAQQRRRACSSRHGCRCPSQGRKSAAGNADQPRLLLYGVRWCPSDAETHVSYHASGGEART
jgi:hypothetical protein